MKNEIFNLFIIILFSSTILLGQNVGINPNDTLHSVEINPDRSVTFRIYAPEAKNVYLGGSDIPDLSKFGKMTKNEKGVWEVTINKLEHGAYRFNFNVDGVPVVDPCGTSVSESNMNVWSLFYLPGDSFMDTQDVPHGAIAVVTYYSASLRRFRRMHIYTPPGYEKNDNKYPVFYLLHGAYDTDDAWSTVGRAGFILDNLIAERKAVPMIVVMPAGHTGPFYNGMPHDTSKNITDEFVEDFNTDIKPFIEKNYRTLNDRKDRAIAGLSMGGAQTLDIAIPHLTDYAYIGVFSSGVFGLNGGLSVGNDFRQAWEKKNEKFLDDENLKKGLKLVWFATGKDDFLLPTSIATVNELKKHKFDVVFKETSGAHTWHNWRIYLNEFAQYLFK
jgi:enterochelin esterase family protein